MTETEKAAPTTTTITTAIATTSDGVMQKVQSSPKGAQFWLVLCSLGLIGFTAALDGSILAIALPYISRDLNLGDKYIYVGNSFVFAQTVVQPGLAQLCDIFGRRWPTIYSIILFAVGSAITGAAKDTGVLILGRVIQGLGSGGIMLLVELVVCDLVPQRERGKYLGIVLSASALGAIAGPGLGGAIASSNWRWCFYMNLPICAVVLVILVFFLRIKHLTVSAWSKVLVQVDWVGNFIFIGSITSLLIGLAFGGTVYPWSSYRTIVPIVVGAVGWAVFHLYEYLIRERNPCVPPRVFNNRTTLAAYYMNFIVSVTLQWVCFYWPIYFLAIRGASLTRTGIDFLPFMFFLVPGSAVVGTILAKTGQYRPLHLIGFVLCTLGPGLNVLLGKHTPTAQWAIFQIIDALGRGFIMSTTLPAVLVGLDEADVAAATGVYSFLRSFGYTWGITIPTIIFQNRFDALLHRITDPPVRATLSGGNAYQLSTGSYLKALVPAVRSQVLDVYLDALKGVWYGAVAFAATGIIAVAVEKHIPLRTELETKYSLEEVKQKEKDAAEVSA